FYFQAGLGTSNLILIAGSQIHLKISVDANNFLEINDGDIKVLVDSQGVAGKITGNVTLAISGIGTIGPTGFDISFSTRPVPTAQNFTVNGVTSALTLDKGTFFKVVVTNLNFTFSGVTVQAASFTFQQQTTTT